MTADRPDPSKPEEPDRGLDVDAAFAEIVAHWVPSVAEPSTDPDTEGAGAADGDEDGADPAGDLAVDPEPDRADPGEQDRLRTLFQPTWSDPLPTPPEEDTRWEPPPPPPIPRPEPRRGLAWLCLFGTPVLALLLLILGVVVPGWATFLMVVAFVGGFGYLVATMAPAPSDPWSGDDGARL